MTLNINDSCIRVSSLRSLLSTNKVIKIEYTVLSKLFKIITKSGVCVFDVRSLLYNFKRLDRNDFDAILSELNNKFPVKFIVKDNKLYYRKDDRDILI